MLEEDFTKIKSRYDINVDDPETIRDLLTKELASCHPDRSGGRFPDENTEKKYHELREAITYLNKNRNNEKLIPISSLTELVKLVSNVVSHSKIPETETVLKNTIHDVIRDHRTGLVFPRFTTAGLSVILTFLFLFPKTVTEHPILKYYIDPNSKIFAIDWIFLLALTVFIWMFTYRQEERNKRTLSKLKLTSIQNDLIGTFLKNLNGDLFTKSELTKYIEWQLLYNDTRWVRRTSIFRVYRSLISEVFGNQLITPEIIQNTADLLIEKSEKNKLIKRIEKGTFDEAYQVIGEIALSSDS